MLVNYTEVAVKQLMPKAVEKIKIQGSNSCLCELCLEDIAASALNKLPPNYVSSRRGVILTEAQIKQLGGEQRILAAIMSASLTVSNNPRHGVDRDLGDLIRDRK